MLYSKIFHIFVEKKYMKDNKLGSERKLNTTKLTGIIGTVNQKDCKSFYINLGGWAYCDYSPEDQIELVHELAKSIKHNARALAMELHSEYLYSFIDVQINDTLYNGKCNSGYFNIEVTIMLENKIDFKTKELTDNATGFCELLTDIILKHPFTFTNRRIKGVKV